MKLGYLVKLYRTIENITVRDLAAEIGTSASTISRVENGKDPDAKTLMKILEWLTK